MKHLQKYFSNDIIALKLLINFTEKYLTSRYKFILLGSAPVHKKYFSWNPLTFKFIYLHLNNSNIII